MESQTGNNLLVVWRPTRSSWPYRRQATRSLTASCMMYPGLLPQIYVMTPTLRAPAGFGGAEAANRVGGIDLVTPDRDGHPHTPPMLRDSC